MNLEFEEIFSVAIRQFYLEYKSAIKKRYTISYEINVFFKQYLQILQNVFSLNSVFVKFPKKGVKFKTNRILKKI